MVKKHVPGPHGLITIEVPAEEVSAPVRKPGVQRRSHSLVKPPRPTHSDNSSQRSRASSSASSKKPMFADDLKKLDEDKEIEFDHKEVEFFPETPEKSEKVAGDNNLTLIEEETEDGALPIDVLSSDDIAQKVQGIDEFEKLKTEKEADELKIVEELEKDQALEQENLSVKGLPKPKDFENDVLDQYTDIPSTAKSTDTLAAGQSSITTAESDYTEKDHGSSMAQQLRPTIPGLFVNNKDVDTTNTGSHSINDVNSSIYSDDHDEVAPGEDLEVPARSEKRNASSSPRKSALKNNSGSTANLAVDDNSPASQAYLSLATAENTRLNALTNHSSSSLGRTTSQRIMIDKPLNGKANGVKPNGPTRPQSQFAGTHPPGPAFREGRPPQRPVTHSNSPSRAPAQIQRPQSSQGMRPQQQHPPNFRPQSAQGSRPPPPYQNPQNRRPQQQGPIPRSASNAAALNATLKKNEPVRPNLEKKSSFEKERTQDSHSAFKRKSLRDPSFGGHQNMESNLGFYRQQASASRMSAQHSAPPQQQQQQNHNNFSSALEGLSNFKSRFNDSDSDIDVPAGKPQTSSFAPPPNNPALRKPKSTYTLRSTSASGMPNTQSPAKSMPEQRATRSTRYFSESDKEQLFNEHLEKAKAAANGEEKKKSKFGGKLRKLFGRSNKD